ncbi:MAG: NUDIX hydrolase [Candidatus Nanoarchaeia archaeon]|nr:NUDIX hydrolase [Candidatus Nanoarchaeia archaeon]
MAKDLAYGAFLSGRNGELKVLGLYNQEKRIIEFPGGEFEVKKDNNYLDTIVREVPEEIRLSGNSTLLMLKDEFTKYEIPTQKNGILIAHVYLGKIDGKVLGLTEEQLEEGRKYVKWIEVKKYESEKLGQIMRSFCQDYLRGKFPNLDLSDLTKLQCFRMPKLN